MKTNSLSLLAACSLLIVACNGTAEKAMDDAANTAENAAEAVAMAGKQMVLGSLPYKLSLAQWSLHKAYFDEGKDPYMFANEAKAMGFEGIEYVSQIYRNDIKKGADHAKSVTGIMSRLDGIASAAGIKEVLIMIDGEGDLGSKDEAARKQSVINHSHWIDAAWASGIPTIRVNAAGEGTKAEVHAQAVKSLSELGAYGKERNVNVVVENHGGYSSDPEWLTSVMAKVNMSNVGILPDFGNFCRVRNPGGWEAGCANAVPNDSIYAAVGMWMKYAHAVSAKSHNFDSNGNETEINYDRMMDTVVAHGYNGFVGVEYEGSELSEREGIMATKALLEKVGVN